MDSTGYLPLAAAAGLQRALDVTANNIANASSPGFRADRLVFESLLTEARPAREPVAYPLMRLSYADTRPGTLSQTGNPLDLAIEGEGVFAYETADGRAAYGRDGRLMLRADGTLVTAAGHAILDDGGAPVQLPEGAGVPQIARDGTLSDQDGALIARIGLYDAPDLSTWERLGDNLFAPREGAPAPALSEAPVILQGASEASNVNPVQEMVRLIEIQRAFDRAVNLGSNQDELRRTTLSKLGQRA